MASGVQEQEGQNDQYAQIDNENGTRQNAEDMHVFPISKSTILFQALLCLAAIYYSMLLTNWGNPTLLDDTAVFFNKSGQSFWI